MSLQPAQIQRLREAFQLVDHDGDGAVSAPDLRRLVASLGIAPAQPMLDALAADSVTFPAFLAMMSERLVQFDPEPDLADAFACFDETDCGLVKVDEMRRWLADVGERMDPQEIDKLLSGPFTDRSGHFHYREWIKVLCVVDEPAP